MVRKKTGKTVPVPAPEGWHWEIRLLSGIVGEPLQLELHDDCADTPLARRTPEASCLVDRPKQIRRESRRILRQWGYERASRAFKLVYVGRTVGQ